MLRFAAQMLSSELKERQRVSTSGRGEGLIVFRTIFLRALPALAVTFALVSSADARKRRWYIEFQGHTPRSAADGREIRSTSPRDLVSGRFRAGGIGAVVARLVRDCHDEAAQLKKWPFEVIARIAALDEPQRSELDNLRVTAHSAADRLAAQCPQASDVAAARLEAVEQAVDAAESAFATMEPVLQRFYASLDDEQKARILRDLTLAHRKPSDFDYVPERRREPRRSPSKASAVPPDGAPPWAGLCQDFTTALRSWPTREIEQGVRLSETQRVVLYELVTASLKAAEALAERCPPETPITPVRRMAMLRVSLQAIRTAATLIKPSFAQFYQALDQGQQAKFVEMR
jgi:hypothetical protein